MARRKKKKESGGGAAWLVTFSDLMTLLLTFFVLLLSMASMDTTVITRISAHSKSLSPMDISGPGQIPRRLQEITAVLKDPMNVLEKKKRIKDLLFPLDLLPKEISQNDLDENLQILAHPEGVVIVLTEGLLFEPGSWDLDSSGKKLLDMLTPVMHMVNADVNVGGHTDNAVEDAATAYKISFMRAAIVMEHFLQTGMKPDRFSLSGYGADRPMYPNESPLGRSKNRRVEILIKSTPRIAGYV